MRGVRGAGVWCVGALRRGWLNWTLYLEEEEFVLCFHSSARLYCTRTCCEARCGAFSKAHSAQRFATSRTGHPVADNWARAELSNLVKLTENE
jgi:hypothetical protein